MSLVSYSNSYSNSYSAKIQVNAVNGTLVKNYRDSFIVRFSLESEMAKTVLKERPYLQYRESSNSWSQDRPVVVIQTMLCGDMQVLCELMWKDDFDKMFEEKEEQPIIDTTKQGKWEIAHCSCGIVYSCSECGVGYKSIEEYCPHCGAKMSAPSTQIKYNVEGKRK